MKKIFLVLVFLALVCGCICGGEPSTEGSTGLADAGVTDAGESNNQDTSTGGAGSGAVSNTLDDIASAISSGMAYECMYNYDGNVVLSLVKGKKFYAEIASPQGKMFSTSDGVWVYTWQAGQSEGTKIKIADYQNSPQQQGKPSTPLDMSGKAIDVKCLPSQASDSRFIPPSSVKFNDLGKMMEDLQKNMGTPPGGGMPSGGGGAPQDMCQVCAMIPDADAKADCLENCNQ